MTDALDPAATALLVMDVQTGIVQRLPDPSSLLDRTEAVLADARAHGAHVGWVRVGFTDAELAAIPATSTMARAASPELHADAPATQIHGRFRPQPQDMTVRKTRIGAFTTTDLGDQLRARGVDTLLLAGISTSGVVLSTVREAMDRDYRIVVLHDACADPDAETHAFLTGRIFPRHTTVIGVDELGWA